MFKEQAKKEKAAKKWDKEAGSRKAAEEAAAKKAAEEAAAKKAAEEAAAAKADSKRPKKLPKLPRKRTRETLELQLRMQTTSVILANLRTLMLMWSYSLKDLLMFNWVRLLLS